MFSIRGAFSDIMDQMRLMRSVESPTDLRDFELFMKIRYVILNG